jgi:hypothetical protein
MLNNMATTKIKDQFRKKRKDQFSNRAMKNYVIQYQKKTLILSPSRIRLYLSTNFVLKLLQDIKEKKI